MRLADLERHFQDHVLTGAAGIEAAVAATVRVPVETRLGIYSGAYRARLEESLQTNYPELAKLLGPEDFHSLAEAYIDRHRSAHFSIRWYGDRLSEMLANNERPLLAELAAWEWAMTLAFDAADVPVLSRETLAAVAPEAWAQLTFKPHPSLQLLALKTNAPQVWKALSHDEAPPVDEAGEIGHWLIWRKDLDTFFRSLPPAECRALTAAIRGEAFAAICEEHAQDVGEERAPAEAAQYLARWLQDGLLTAR